MAEHNSSRETAAARIRELWAGLTPAERATLRAEFVADEIRRLWRQLAREEQRTLYGELGRDLDIDVTHNTATGSAVITINYGRRR